MIPPVFVHMAQRLRHGGSPVEWEYVPDGWDYARTHPEVRGWNVAGVLDAYTGKWPQFVQMAEGTEPLGVAHESALATNEDILSHNATMAFRLLPGAGCQRKSASFAARLGWGDRPLSTTGSRASARC